MLESKNSLKMVTFMSVMWPYLQRGGPGHYEHFHGPVRGLKFKIYFELNFERRLEIFWIFFPKTSKLNFLIQKNRFSEKWDIFEQKLHDMHLRMLWNCKNFWKKKYWLKWMKIWPKFTFSGLDFTNSKKSNYSHILLL